MLVGRGGGTERVEILPPCSCSSLQAAVAIGGAVRCVANGSVGEFRARVCGTTCEQLVYMKSTCSSVFVQ